MSDAVMAAMYTAAVVAEIKSDIEGMQDDIATIHEAVSEQLINVTSHRRDIHGHMWSSSWQEQCSPQPGWV